MNTQIPSNGSPNSRSIIMVLEVDWLSFKKTRLNIHAVTFWKVPSQSKYICDLIHQDNGIREISGAAVNRSTHFGQVPSLNIQ